MIRPIFSWLTICGILLLPRCATSPVCGIGGSSETVNAKLIIADTTVNLTVDTENCGELTMRIYSTDYRPYEKRGLADSTAPATANDLHWNAPASGSYNILLTTATKNVSGFIRNVSLKHGVYDTISCVLKPSRNLSGSIVASGNPITPETFMVAIYGSPFVALSDTAGRFSISDMPPGSYSICVRSTAKRLFVTSSSYPITTEMFDESTTVRMILP
jgi:hypothetical protein